MVSIEHLSPDEIKDFKEGFLKRMSDFKADFHSRSQQQALLLGRYIHCHLLIESRLSRLINIEIPKIKELKNIARHFDEKLEILESLESPPFQGSYSAVRAINTIRNKFAHNPSYLSIDNSHLGPVREFLDTDTTKMQPIEVVEMFTIIFCAGVTAIEVGLNIDKEVQEKLAEERKQLEKVREENRQEAFRLLDEIFGEAK